MSQICTLLLLASTHTRSSVLSPLKLPLPTTCHSDPIWAGPLPPWPLLLYRFDRLEPFIPQIVVKPASDCHRMSALPSPSKSPTSTICHSLPICAFST